MLRRCLQSCALFVLHLSHRGVAFQCNLFHNTLKRRPKRASFLFNANGGDATNQQRMRIGDINNFEDIDDVDRFHQTRRNIISSIPVAIATCVPHATFAASNEKGKSKELGRTKTQTTNRGKIIVYLAMSVDGKIAGNDGDLSWLDIPSENADSEGEVISSLSLHKEFEEVLANTGCIVMGRTTYDTVVGFGEDMWPYADIPIIVVSHRDLPSNHRHSVNKMSGDMGKIIMSARQYAGPDKDVYVDGGNVVQQALRENIVQEITLTIIPIVLGEGRTLFEQVPKQRLRMVQTSSNSKGMTQVTYSIVDERNILERFDK